MLKLTLAATAMIVGSLLVQPQATAAGRYPGPVTVYPFPIPLPNKLPLPAPFPVDACKGIAAYACGNLSPLPPIAPPRLPPSDPCKGLEQCAVAPLGGPF
jgi:hypothetical protein